MEPNTNNHTAVPQAQTGGAPDQTVAPVQTAGDQEPIEVSNPTASVKSEPNKPKTAHLSKMTLVAGVLGVLLLITALTLVIFRSIEGDLFNSTNGDDLVVSENETIFSDLFSFIDSDLNDINEEDDLADFDDSELAVEETEEELDSAIDEIDELMEDIDSLEDDLADFDDSELSL